jgi:hypothetical protein
MVDWYGLVCLLCIGSWGVAQLQSGGDLTTLGLQMGHGGQNHEPEGEVILYPECSLLILVEIVMGTAIRVPRMKSGKRLAMRMDPQEERTIME